MPSQPLEEFDRQRYHDHRKIDVLWKRMCMEPPIPFEVPVTLPNNSAITLFWVNPHTNWLNVITIGRYHPVFGQIHRMQRTCQNGFLTII